jgi:signal transduction histidine kinase
MSTNSIGKRVGGLVFLLATLPLAALEGTLLLAGWILVACLAITPLVVPALVAFRAGAGWSARLEGWLANSLLGTSLDPPTSSGGSGFWGRGAAVVRDETFWKQQVYLLEGVVLRSAIAIAELTLIAVAGMAVALPLYYGSSDTQLGSWHVDTLQRALLFVPAGIVVMALALYLLGPIAALFRTLAVSLLRPPAPIAPGLVQARRRRALVWHAVFYGCLNAVLVLVWALTSAAYFWPVWTLLSLGFLLGIHAWIVAVLDHDDLVRARGFTIAVAIEAGVSFLLCAFLVAVWAVTGGGYFWPGWVILALVAVVAAHAAIDRKAGGSRRIATLETTRAGVIDQQDSELRRIERDLHDGAQARLVALGMSLGMAEQKLASDPDAAQALLAEARLGAHEALEELRDLARGIHPPVLADRGLEAAISALAVRSPLHIEVSVELPSRPAPAIETAAYFVVTEALTNTGKHAGAENVQIAVRRKAGTLLVAVTDDGHGAADPGGSGLQGLRRRVEALDGTLEVTSPEGGPTTIAAVIPCAW